MSTRDDGTGYRLKPLSKEGIGPALERAEHYRLLNEAREAESICRDVLRADPGNQRAVVTLLLAVTDQFKRDCVGKYQQARDLLSFLESEYARAYYTGLICERRAKAQHLMRAPRTGHVTYEWLRDAMEHYEKAEELRPAGNDDPVLRWNACVRMIRTHPDIEPSPSEEAVLLE